jgi:hypothetical protein
MTHQIRSFNKNADYKYEQPKSAMNDTECAKIFDEWISAQPEEVQRRANDHVERILLITGGRLQAKATVLRLYMKVISFDENMER